MPDIPVLEFLWRLSVAVALGALIGVERQVSHHTAGLKTNALVATGSAMFMMLAGFPGAHPDAYSRIAAQIISGMGFLGGGVILRDGLHVRGLTTAATLWCAAAVGTLAGAGATRRAVIGCIAVLCINVILKPLSRKLGEDSLTGEGVTARYRVRILCSADAREGVRSEFIQLARDRRYTLEAVKSARLNDHEAEVSVDFSSPPNGNSDVDPLVAHLSTRDGVVSVDWQRLLST